MTQAEKLEALIKRAESNGFNFGVGKITVLPNPEDEDDTPILSYGNAPRLLQHPYMLLFNHDFARALFGDEINNYIPDYLEGWSDEQNPHLALEARQWHLQQAVISQDPIDYMYQVVFENE